MATLKGEGSIALNVI